MEWKRLIALVLCVIMLVSVCACNNKNPDDTTSDGGTTSATTESVLSTQTVQTEAIRIPVEEIVNAIKIESAPVTKTKEIPLIVILANFDADGDGEDDWDESVPNKLYSDKNQPYYGEQWAGSELMQHYQLYFGEGMSLTNYYEELTMGAFKFVPIEFDVLPPGSPVQNGMIEVTVPIPHPTASGNAGGTITKIFEATDPYIDYTKYDTNNNNKIDATELGVVILNPGQDKSNGTNTMGGRQYFQVHGTSQSLNAYCDGLSFSKVSNFGEYGKSGGIMQIGTPAHELAHNLGAEDLYDTNRNGHGGSTVAGWPRAYDFSLECNGNHRSGGAYPTYLDPYHRVYLGWAQEKVVGDGVYTISSTLTDKYTVLRVNTPDPDEYYLIEVRLKEGFEARLTDGNSKGGIMVWHIDEALNRRYFVEGSASTSTAVGGKRHDPAIVPLFRTGYDAAGQYMSDTTPDDPFYYYSDDPTTALFDSGKFRSVTNGTQSLNSYPKTWEGKENYNLRVEVLSAPGQEMTIKISGSQDGRKDFAPVISATYDTKTHNSITVVGNVDSLNGATITDCAVALSTSADFTENLVTKAGTYDAEAGKITAVFDGLTPETKYYYKVYLISDNGYAEAHSDTPTLAAPKEKTSMKIALYSDSDAKAYTITVAYGKTAASAIPAGWLKSITGKHSGQKLEGWYLDEACTQAYDINAAIAKGTEDFSLYAKWVAN
jgi:M6 family metalloprotease-like protein